ncbi:hypothetical protein DYB28_012107 [Aphanomyces astaci]|uniref:Uncharacterized protein n=1 Tax=Aphanomyces astaci TaxID=112090 RepID=A0A9X8H8I7_APHAT|nr:hypothetical protein DYB28_012107 [Aphanomyces astaci]
MNLTATQLGAIPPPCHHKLRIDFLVSPDTTSSSQPPRTSSRSSGSTANGSRKSKPCGASSLPKRTALRSGGWTEAEMEYTLRLSADFKDGLVSDAATGILLRQYLSLKLNCSPMRLSKKFDKSSGILGMHRYDPTASVLSGLTPEMRRLRKKELKQLEDAFHKNSSEVKADVMQAEVRSMKRRRLHRHPQEPPTPCAMMAPLDLLVALACHAA